MDKRSKAATVVICCALLLSGLFAPPVITASLGMLLTTVVASSVGLRYGLLAAAGAGVVLTATGSLLLYQLLFIAAGFVIIAVGIGRRTDIIQLQQQALAKHTERLELLFSQAQDGFFFMMLDEPIAWHDSADKEALLDYVFHHQRVTQVNQALLEQYRAQERDFLGRTAYDLCQHNLAESRAVWRRLFDRGRWQVEREERRFDNSTMVIEGHYICLYDPQGRVTGHLAIQADITERRQAEHDAQLHLQLERTAAELAQQLLAQPAQQIKTGAKQVLATIGQLLAADRTFVFEFDHDTISRTYEWSAAGIKPQKAGYQDQPLAELPGRQEQLVLNDTGDAAPDTYAGKLAAQGVRARLWVPMHGSQGMISLIGADALTTPRRWQESDIHLLEISGSILASAMERSRAENELRRLTFFDPVTGLYNRRYFEETVEQLERQGQRPLSLIMVDVNGLKIVNDSLGHHSGDKLLRTMAQVLQKACRAEDIAARWGGDEFVILMPLAGDREAKQVCQTISTLCAAADPTPIHLSAAWGYATAHDSDTAIVDILRQAEDHMYKHKMMSAHSNRSALVTSLQRTLQEKSHETEDHARSIQWLALALGRKLELPDAQLHELSLLALLHDIGKVGISEAILDKPSSLSPDEWEIMQKHSDIGYRIAIAAPDLAVVAEGILAHHERWDGCGYPRQLKGEQIPLLARIVALADAFDAMTTDRPYRKGMPVADALEEIEVCAGFQFDPGLVTVFTALIRERQADRPKQLVGG